MLTKSGQIDVDSLVKEGFLSASPRAHGGLHYHRTQGSVIDFSTKIDKLINSKIRRGAWIKKE